MRNTSTGDTDLERGLKMPSSVELRLIGLCDLRINNVRISGISKNPEHFPFLKVSI
jgi:hypothetical protein